MRTKPIHRTVFLELTGHSFPDSSQECVWGGTLHFVELRAPAQVQEVTRQLWWQLTVAAVHAGEPPPRGSGSWEEQDLPGHPVCWLRRAECRSSELSR